MKKDTLLVLLSVVFVGCAQQDLTHYSQRERRQAPTNQRDVGVLLSQVSTGEIAVVLDQYPEAKFRKINTEHGLYEIFGVSTEQVAELLPNAGATQNDFVPMNLQDEHEDTQHRLLQQAQEKKSLRECKEDFESPTAIIEPLSPAEMVETNTILRGAKIQLSNKLSAAHEAHAGAITKAWLVAAPEGSKQNETILTDEVVDFQPDSLGIYQFLLVVQDERDVCAVEIYPFIVTENQPFKGIPADVDDVLKRFDLKLFKHLPGLNVEKSWQVSTGKDVVIAILDSGVNYNHQALVKNILVNKGEIPGNDKDDDENGFVDDVVGYDFANQDAFPFDDVGHGSHVAGLAASSLFGIAKEAKILPVKALSPAGGDIGSITGSIMYAVDRGAKILNMSFGNYGRPHPKMAEAMTYAETHNVIVVAAAGNGHPQTGAPLNTDRVPNYPSAFDNDNIIAVAARAKDKILASYSNYGKKTVDIAIDGGDGPDDLILSSFLDNPSDIFLVQMAGTSMATPIAAGVVAQVLSINPNLTIKEAKKLIMSSGAPVKELKALIQSGRSLDPFDAVQKALKTIKKPKKGLIHTRPLV